MVSNRATHHRKLTASVIVTLDKIIFCVSNNPKAVNPFLTIQTKTRICEYFFLDCPKIPFWSVLSLNCCRLFKVYTSYIISKCRSIKMINQGCSIIFLDKYSMVFGPTFLSLVSPK